MTERLLKKFSIKQTCGGELSEENARKDRSGDVPMERPPSADDAVVLPVLSQNGRVLLDLSGEEFDHIRKLLSNQYQDNRQDPFVIERILPQVSLDDAGKSENKSEFSNWVSIFLNMWISGIFYRMSLILDVLVKIDFA